MKSIGKWLKHFFVPHEGNEYRPHVLREISVLAFLFVVLFTFAAGQLHRVIITGTDFLAAIYSNTLVDLANADRRQSSIGSLTINPILEKAAAMKAEDMATKGYFAHYSPDGKAPWDWIRLAGYSYVAAGENLAIDFTDSNDVNNAWMNSPTHRANLLNGRYTEIGIATKEGIYQGRPTTFVVQMFGRPAAIVAPVAAAPISKPIAAAPKPASNPVAVAQTSVKGAEVELQAKPQENIIVSQVTTDAPDAPILQAVKEESRGSRLISRINSIASNPSSLLEKIYIFLGILIFIGLCGFATIELERHHYKHVAYGFLMLTIIFSLGYIYKISVFTRAVVAGLSF